MGHEHAARSKQATGSERFSGCPGCWGTESRNAALIRERARGTWLNEGVFARICVRRRNMTCELVGMRNFEREAQDSAGVDQRQGNRRFMFDDSGYKLDDGEKR
jgi:hypothetical protein